MTQRERQIILTQIVNEISRKENYRNSAEEEKNYKRKKKEIPLFRDNQSKNKILIFSSISIFLPQEGGKIKKEKERTDRK